MTTKRNNQRIGKGVNIHKYESNHGIHKEMFTDISMEVRR